jgi:hypothetical protein
MMQNVVKLHGFKIEKSMLVGFMFMKIRLLSLLRLA